MVNHHGPLPLKELHSTGETIVWRDPGGSWACLPPVYRCNHTATVCDTCGKPLWEEVYKMLRRTTKPLRRILIEEGLAKSSKKQQSENTDKWHLCKTGSFSYGESPRTPPLEGTSLHRWNNSVERPWGILSLFTTCLQVQSTCHSLWHMWNTPQTAH